MGGELNLMSLEDDLKYVEKLEMELKKEDNLEIQETSHIPKYLQKEDFDKYKSMVSRHHFDDLQATPRLCRLLVLHEFRKGKPIFESYKTFLFNWGHVEYQEFEFWFMRFSRVKFDLDYDRSKKAIPKATFSDLPMEIVKNITESLKFEDILSARRVSSGLRSTVDSQYLYFDDVEIVIKDDIVEMQFGPDNIIRYPRTPFLSKPVSTQLITDMIIMLRMRRYQLNSFSILIDSTEKTPRIKWLISDFITELVYSLDARIMATTLRICCNIADMFPMMLSGFLAGALEKIQMFADTSNDNDWHWVYQSEQFKKAIHFDRVKEWNDPTVFHVNPQEFDGTEFGKNIHIRGEEWCRGDQKGVYMNPIFDARIMDLAEVLRRQEEEQLARRRREAEGMLDRYGEYIRRVIILPRPEFNVRLAMSIELIRGGDEYDASPITIKERLDRWYPEVGIRNSGEVDKNELIEAMLPYIP